MNFVHCLTTYVQNLTVPVIVISALLFCTGNVTGRRRGPKRKLRAGYRAPSRNRSCYVPSVIFLSIGRRQV